MGVPGRIVEIRSDQPHLGTVDLRGKLRQVNLGLLEPQHPKPGDWVDVHLGLAVALLEEEEAMSTLSFLESLEGDADP
jgi:hydrogenase expression/formation protein HypC